MNEIIPESMKNINNCFNDNDCIINNNNNIYQCYLNTSNFNINNNINYNFCSCHKELSKTIISDCSERGLMNIISAVIYFIVIGLPLFIFTIILLLNLKNHIQIVGFYKSLDKTSFKLVIYLLIAVICKLIWMIVVEITAYNNESYKINSETMLYEDIYVRPISMILVVSDVAFATACTELIIFWFKISLSAKKFKKVRLINVKKVVYCIQILYAVATILLTTINLTLRTIVVVPYYIVICLFYQYAKHKIEVELKSNVELENDNTVTEINNKKQSRRIVKNSKSLSITKIVDDINLTANKFSIFMLITMLSSAPLIISNTNGVYDPRSAFLLQDFLKIVVFFFLNISYYVIINYVNNAYESVLHHRSSSSKNSSKHSYNYSKDQDSSKLSSKVTADSKKSPSSTFIKKLSKNSVISEQSLDVSTKITDI